MSDLTALVAAMLEQGGLWPQYPRSADVWGKHATKMLATPAGQRLARVIEAARAYLAIADTFVCQTCAAHLAGGETHGPDCEDAALRAAIDGLGEP